MSFTTCARPRREEAFSRGACGWACCRRSGHICCPASCSGCTRRITSYNVCYTKLLRAFVFGKKNQSVITSNVTLLEAGHAWAEANLEFKYRIPAAPVTEPQIVVNGNTALALGVLASGMEICAMYPITPATSASHYLSDVFEKVGGIVHQAEDEISYNFV